MTVCTRYIHILGMGSSAPSTGIVDAYTHYAPLALAKYLQEDCNDGKPLVFAKLFERTEDEGGKTYRITPRRIVV
jgi:hypothetical protein